MLRFVFDHPLVEAFTIWDFADGAWLGAPSGVIRKDNSKKPSYEMLSSLIHKEWHTSADVMTDENGYAEFDGFMGQYTVTGGQVHAEFHLGKTSPDTISVRCSRD